MGGSKCSFHLAFSLEHRSIDTWYLPQIPVRALEEIVHEGNQPLIIRLMTAPRVSDTSPAAEKVANIVRH